MKKLMEKANNLKHWNTFKSGGHFAPMEQPIKMKSGNFFD